MEKEMEDRIERLALPFTFLFKRESAIWTALACEVDVASCGDTKDQARDALKDAVGLYVLDMFASSQQDHIERPISEGALQEFYTNPPPEEPITVENQTMIVVMQRPDPVIEFVPALLAQMTSRTAVTSG